MPNLIEPVYICQPEEVELLAEASERYLAKGDFESMEHVLTGMSAVEPNTAWVFSSLGYAQHQQGKLEDAELSYRRAIALSEVPDTMASVNLIGIFLAQRRVDEAIDQLAKVIESGDRSEPVAIAVARFANMLADYGIGVDEPPAKPRARTKKRPVKTRAVRTPAKRRIAAKAPTPKKTGARGKSAKPASKKRR
jgi:tetratricopeptide (TPR) repeat protein